MDDDDILAITNDRVGTARTIRALRAALAASQARERGLRGALEGLAASLEERAARVYERHGWPTTPLRYAEMLRSFAYDAREALRAALAEEPNDG